MSKKNGMIGVIVGDIAGSRFKRNNHRSKDFELLVHPDVTARERVEAWKRWKMAYESGANKVAIREWLPSFKDRPCAFTQNTVIALAVAAALLDWSTLRGDLGASATKYMQEFARRYPHLEYGFVPGGNFSSWLRSNAPRPYNSWGNGAAMRVSACGWAGLALDEVKTMSRAVTEVTHNHPEGIKGAEVTAVATFLARTGKSMEEIREVIVRDYYPLDFTLDEIRSTYEFDVSCQGSVPQALEAFFESASFKDAIRNAISIGGDSDTIGAICGAVAGAYYGIPEGIRMKAETFLDAPLLKTLHDFESRILGYFENK